MLPSTLCMHYLHTSTKVIPERQIRIGARYRTRRDLDEHVRGYRVIKKGLQRRLAEIEHDRRSAHYALPMAPDALWASLRSEAHVQDFPRPLGNFLFRPTYYKGPLFKSKIEIGWTEARHEPTLGIVDVRRKMFKNPSEKLNKD